MPYAEKTAFSEMLREAPTVGRNPNLDAAWNNTSGFLDFYTTLGEMPGNGYKVGRIANTKGFVKGNVQWVPK